VSRLGAFAVLGWNSWSDAWRHPGGDFPRHRVVGREQVAERVRVRDITNDEGNRLLGIVRRSSGSVVTWRRAQMVLLSAQGMDVAQIAQGTFASPDRVRDVLDNFNLDGFDALCPRYRGGRPPTFTLAQRRQIKQVALSRPVDHDLPFSTWSLAKLAEFLVAEGWSTTPVHEGLRLVLREEGVSFQLIKTWKAVQRPCSCAIYRPCTRPESGWAWCWTTTAPSVDP
jgi:transposase